MSTITQLICNNFGGIRQKNAVFNSDLITASDIQNVELYYTGTNGGVGIRTMQGNIAVNDSLKNSEKIINIFESIQDEKTYFFVHSESDTEGKFYLYDTSLNTLILKKSGLSITGISNGFDIAQGWSDLFFFTNGAEMFTLEIGVEDEIVDFNLIDVENEKVIGLGAALFDNRLWIFNKNKLWYSSTSNIYDFSTHSADFTTSAGKIETLKNITAIHEYLGSLAIFYNNSSELLSVSDGIFSRSEESPGGCAGINSLVFHNTDLYFYDDTKKAVFSFKQIVTGEKTLGENCAIEIQDELRKINTSDLNKIQALSVFITGRNEIWFNIPDDNSNYSNILIFDCLKGEWTKRKSQKINASAIINNKLFSASNDGCILEEYNGNDFNGEYIEHYYNFSPLTLGAVNTLKVLAFPPRISLDTTENSKFYVKYRKNLSVIKKPKIKFIKTKDKLFAQYDVSYYDDSYYPLKTYSKVCKFPSATFKILEIFLYTTEKKQDFSIRNIEFSKIKVKQI